MMCAHDSRHTMVAHAASWVIVACTPGHISLTLQRHRLLRAAKGTGLRYIQPRIGSDAGTCTHR